MTARLPVVNSDNNAWGTLLNAFLSVSHNADGTLYIADGVSLQMIDGNAVVNNVLKINSNNYAQFTAPASNVFEFADNSGNALFYLNGITQAFQLGPGITFNADDSGFVAGAILFVTSGGATVLKAHPTLNIVEVEDSSGNVAWTTQQSSSAASLSNGSTIITTGVGGARVTASGNVTGIILQAGTTATQEVVVYNESAFTVTFDVVGTSHVADGTSSVINANRAMFFSWNSAQSKWYHS